MTENLLKVHERINKHIANQFKGETIILDNTLSNDDEDTDIFNYMTTVVLVKKVDGSYHYKPLLESQKAEVHG